MNKDHRYKKRQNFNSCSEASIKGDKAYMATKKGFMTSFKNRIMNLLHDNIGYVISV